MIRFHFLLLSTVPLLLEAVPAKAGCGNVRVSGAEAVTAVRRASRGASRRLSQLDCGRVFSDFTDGRGWTLRENLDGLGRTGPQHLGFVLFYDARDEGRCRDAGVHAFTAPDSIVVHVCPRFTSLQRRDPRLAEVIVIHEILHTLGLGEDPPTSRDINERIVTRCGR